MTTPDKLLPCPFCGAAPRIYLAKYSAFHNNGTSVICDGCGVRTDYQKGAVERWNTRAGWNPMSEPPTEMTDVFMKTKHGTIGVGYWFTGKDSGLPQWNFVAIGHSSFGLRDEEAVWMHPPEDKKYMPSRLHEKDVAGQLLDISDYPILKIDENKK